MQGRIHSGITLVGNVILLQKDFFLNSHRDQINNVLKDYNLEFYRDFYISYVKPFPKRC